LNFAFHTSATVAPQLMPVDFTALFVKKSPGQVIETSRT